MEKHFELNDTEFTQQFENCTLEASLFSHEAHLRLAWIYIRQFGSEEAISIIRNQIQRYAASLGAHDKYNETVTVASVKAVAHFIRKSKSDTFAAFISENQQLKTHFKQLLATHYSTDIFTSETAKTSFLEAELDPFD
jgi:hypothetical protein